MENQESKQAAKIDGWLILVAIGVIFAPLRILYVLITTYLPMFSDGTWEALTNTTSEYYSPLFKSIFMAETVLNSIVLIVSIYLIYLFYTKSKMFPKWFFGLALFSVIFITVDALAISFVWPEVPAFDEETIKELMRPLISLFIWSPYLFISKRSKITFIN